MGPVVAPFTAVRRLLTFDPHVQARDTGGFNLLRTIPARPDDGPPSGRRSRGSILFFGSGVRGFV